MNDDDQVVVHVHIGTAVVATRSVVLFTENVVYNSLLCRVFCFCGLFCHGPLKHLARLRAQRR